MNYSWNKNSQSNNYVWSYKLTSAGIWDSTQFCKVKNWVEFQNARVVSLSPHA